VDVTRDNVNRYHGVASSSLYAPERRIIDQYLRPSMNVLELGCGAGRVTNAMGRRGLRVVAGDLDYEALHACRDLTAGGAVRHLQLDARCLPFKNGSIDVVLFAFNGLDYIHPETARIATIGAIANVLKGGGLLIFSSHNPLGGVLSPRGRFWTSGYWRLRQSTWRSIRQPYWRAPGGLLLYHASPQSIAAQVTAGTGLKLVEAFGRSGLSLPLWLLHLVDAWPYFVFEKPA
jgi:SAM-dependent methyltransferase